MNSLRVVWRADQIYPFESIWGMLHKLCRWNCIHFVDVWELIAVRGRTFEARAAAKPTSHTLFDPTWIDRVAFKRLLNLSDECADGAFLDRYVCVSGLQDTTMRHLRGLQFCEDCLGRGLHSTLHNLPFFEECPIDHGPLLTACPRCARPIRYSAPAEDAFCCPCGHSLWAGRKCTRLSGPEETALRNAVMWIDLLKAGIFGPASNQDRSKRPNAVDEITDQVFTAYSTCLEAVEKAIRDPFEDRWQRLDNATSRKASRMTTRLYAWRCFWEGDGFGMSTDRSQVANAVCSRFLSIFPADSGIFKQHDCKRLMIGALQGTLVELWHDAPESLNLDGARHFSENLKGTFVPFCVAQPLRRRSVTEHQQSWLGFAAATLNQIFDAWDPHTR